MTARPLEGVIVLDLSRILAGPYASQKLGDMGATVWKVERPGKGDETRTWGPPFHEGISTYFMAVNRSKRSIAVDLKAAAGKEVIARMIARADVVLENFRPGTLERLGFSWERIHELNQRAIYCSISGYGAVGKHRDRASFDVIAQGESGAQSLTGDPEGPPTKFGLSIADITAGQHAVEGILLALLRRERTGEGDRVDIALADGLLALLTYQAQMVLTGGVAPRRLGNAHPSIVPYQTFATADGWINIGVGNDAQWARFCEVIERPDLGADERYATNRDRVEQRTPLVETIQETLRGQTTAAWFERLQGASIPVGPIREVPEALEDARTDARGMITTVQHPTAGPLPMVGNAVKLTSIGMDPAYAPPPGVGEHTDAILAELGYGPDAIASLRKDRVIG